MKKSIKKESNKISRSKALRRKTQLNTILGTAAILENKVEEIILNVLHQNKEMEMHMNKSSKTQKTKRFLKIALRKRA